MFLGATERGASRLMASRVPAPIVHTRRRSATKTAKTTGDTPSQAPLAVLAWHLLSPKVPTTIGPTETVGKV